MSKLKTDYYNHTQQNYLTSQKYMECQLVTAINAAICLDEFPVMQNSIEYERLVDFASGRIGSVINIERVWKYLRLKTFNIQLSWKNVQKYLKDEVINRRNPMEFTVTYQQCRHSVLLVDCKQEKGSKYVRVMNFKSATKNGWICWTRFLGYVRRSEHKNKLPPTMRIFMLDPWYIRHLQIEFNQKTLT